MPVLQGKLEYFISDVKKKQPHGQVKNTLVKAQLTTRPSKARKNKTWFKENLLACSAPIFKNE
jgi:hypothetical protein